MPITTPTIDCQVHAYERNTPEKPWRAILTGPDEVTGDDMVQAMDAVGVDGAVLVSPFAIYGYDPSYVLSVYAKHPDRFGLVKPFESAFGDGRGRGRRVDRATRCGRSEGDARR